ARLDELDLQSALHLMSLIYRIPPNLDQSQEQARDDALLATTVYDPQVYLFYAIGQVDSTTWIAYQPIQQEIDPWREIYYQHGPDTDEGDEALTHIWAGRDQGIALLEDQVTSWAFPHYAQYHVLQSAIQAQQQRFLAAESGSQTEIDPQNRIAALEAEKSALFEAWRNELRPQLEQLQEQQMKLFAEQLPTYAEALHMEEGVRQWMALHRDLSSALAEEAEALHAVIDLNK
ncbi:MAG: hypothetical protein KDE31_11220, partial [Caldilineaceae bacterium]|nr:hypothetical protein [Caldilineaceae bacterium]